MGKFYAVMMSDKSIIATGESFDECSDSARNNKPWPGGAAPYYIQDFNPDLPRPKFHMSYHECSIDGQNYIQAFGRVERVKQLSA